MKKKLTTREMILRNFQVRAERGDKFTTMSLAFARSVA